VRRLVLLLTVLALTALSSGAAIAAQQQKDPAAEKSWPAPAAQELSALAGMGTTPVGRATLRVAGADRFTTAAAIADEVWDYENTLIVYLANGLNFPDALGLGASTLSLGPLLLVTKDGLPEVTRNQLARLRPCFIVAAGGAGAISDRVLAEADRYADPAGCDGLY
jgi:putative cell wall-binding protein